MRGGLPSKILRGYKFVKITAIGFTRCNRAAELRHLLFTAYFKHSRMGVSEYKVWVIEKSSPYVLS